MKTVKVVWTDSRRYIDEMPQDEKVEFCVMNSVGFLVSKSGNQVVLCQDSIENNDNQIRGVLVIPKSNIVEIKYLN